MKLKSLLEGRAERAAEKFIGGLVAQSPFKGHVYLVGGAVRDELRGLEPKDLDFVITQKDGGIKFAEWICKHCGVYKHGSNPVIYPRFGTAKFQLYGVKHDGVDIGHLEFESVMTRTEKYQTGSRKPSVEFGDIEQDAKRRDLTFNAIYKQVDTGRIVDPLKVGIRDLKANIVRTTSDPDVIFVDDPLRMLRAVRFTVRDKSTLPVHMFRAIKKNAHSLKTISSERIYDELSKILKTHDADKGVRILALTGLLHEFLPEVHTPDLNGLKASNADIISRMAALLRPAGRAAAQKVMTRLKCTNDEIKKVSVLLGMSIVIKDTMDDAAIRKLRLEYGDDLFSHIVDFAVKVLGHGGRVAHHWRTVPMVAKMPINGDDVIRMLQLDKKTDGQKVGKILAVVRDAWLKDPTMRSGEALKIAQSASYKL